WPNNPAGRPALVGTSSSAGISTARTPSGVALTVLAGSRPPAATRFARSSNTDPRDASNGLGRASRRKPCGGGSGEAHRPIVAVLGSRRGPAARSGQLTCQNPAGRSPVHKGGPENAHSSSPLD